MSAHTPGPWECFYKQKYDEWHVSLPLAGQTMRLGLFEDGCPTERPEADARLIAAAPELLDALRWFVMLQLEAGEGYDECFERVGEVFRRDTGYLRPGKDCRMHDGPTRDAAWEKWVQQHVAAARAAIAKAVQE